MGHYTGYKISTTVSVWNKNTYFFAVKIPPQGGRRYDQARFVCLHKIPSEKNTIKSCQYCNLAPQWL